MERRTLKRFALAITEGGGGKIDADEERKLGPAVLGLLDALIEQRMS